MPVSVSPAAPSPRASVKLPGKRFAASRYVAHLLMMPAVVTMVLLMGFPLLYLGYMSLHSWTLLDSAAPTWVGLSNFVALGGDERFLNALGRTLLFTVMGLAVSLPGGLTVALLLHEEFPGRNLARALLVLPMVATPVAMGLVWVIMLDPTIGVVRYALAVIGFHAPLWLSNERIVVPTLVMIDAWAEIPMVALICVAGLAAIPIEGYEAATMAGAGRWQQFWYITLPLLRPILFVAMIFRVINLLKVIDVIYAVTQGGPGYSSETLNFYNFQVALTYFRVGYGASVALCLFGMVLAATLGLIRFRRAAW